MILCRTQILVTNVHNLTIKELLVRIKDREIEIYDSFDASFFNGAKHVIENCGDGGLSEQYIAGIQWALEQLKPEEIGGQG